MQTLLVVDAIEKLPDAPFRLGEIFILEQVDFFVFGVPTVTEQNRTLRAAVGTA